MDATQVLLLPFHIKLDLIKQSVKALDKNNDFFWYLSPVFPHLLEGKIKGVFVSPDIKWLMKDWKFDGKINSIKEKYIG